MTRQQAGQPARIVTNATRRLDSLNWSSWHTRTVTLLGIGWALDAFETCILAPLLVLIQKDFGVETVAEASWITSVWLIGAIIGSLLFGWIGDRFGRRKTFMLTIFSYSICTIITALSPNYYFFLVFRGLTSIGVAGEYSAVTASIAEFVPSKHRGKLSVVVQGSWGLGALLANAVDIPLVKYLPDNISWRVACCLGAAFGLITMIFRYTLPESPRWLLSKGRIEEAHAIVDKIERDAKQEHHGDSIAKIEFDVRETKPFLSQCYTLWATQPLTTLFACILDTSQAFGAYAMANFLGLAVLPNAMPQEEIPFFYTIASLGSFPGIAFAATLIDFIGRKKLLPISYFLCGIACYCIYPAYLTQNRDIIIVAGFFYYVFYQSSGAVAYSMFSEIFPTHIRSSGIGMAVSVGRIGGFISPLLTSYIYENTTEDRQNVLGGLLVVMCLFMVTVIASIPWAIYGTEGTGLSLEEASEGRKTVKEEVGDKTLVIEDDLYHHKKERDQKC